MRTVRLWLILAKDSYYHIDSSAKWQMREGGHMHGQNEEEEDHETQPGGRGEAASNCAVVC
jgi:hypothetical protein